MLKAFWQARWYLLLGLFTFILVLLLTTPLHFVWRYVQPQLPPLPVVVEQVSGTIWHGRAQLQAPAELPLGTVSVQWQLEPLSLLLGRVQATVKAEANHVRLTTRVMAGLDQRVRVEETQGYMDAELLRPTLSAGQASLEGFFELQQMHMHLDLASLQVLALEGRIIFSGGPVGFLVDGKPISAELPLLVGQLQQTSETVSSLLMTTEDGLAVGDVFWQQNGWGGVKMRRRFLDILGQPWPAQADADSIIFEASHKIL